MTVRVSSPPAAVALQLAALLSWLAVGLPAIVQTVTRGASVPASAALASWAVFGAAALVALLRQGTLPRRHAVLLVGVQSAATVAFAWATRGGGVETVLLVMVASQLPGLVSWRMSAAWVLAQTLACAVPLIGRAEATWVVVAVVVRLGFQAFGLGAMYFASLEAQARWELARVNEELRAAQALQTENARLAERLRIARDLHDTLGHHLTALSLNLEVATHLVDGRAAGHVETARDLARLLLAEVRDVVASTRGETAADLVGGLRALAHTMTHPRIHLDIPDGLEAALPDPAAAQALFRCAQEAVTNAVRHAAAENVWIALRRDAEGVRLQARDDGRGAAEVRPGHGLQGMRERLEEVGGALTVDSAPGRGFALVAFVPVRDAAA